MHGESSGVSNRMEYVLLIFSYLKGRATKFLAVAFCDEARRQDGNFYSPATIHNLLSCLYRYSKSKVPSGTCSVGPNFMNCRDPAFRDVRGALQVRYRQLRIDGFGAYVKHAPIITHKG